MQWANQLMNKDQKNATRCVRWYSLDYKKKHLLKVVELLDLSAGDDIVGFRFSNWELILFLIISVN